MTRPRLGWVHTDADGYLINDGQEVFVDEKIVSYPGGKIIITTAPETTRCGRPLPGKPACVHTTLIIVPHQWARHPIRVAGRPLMRESSTR
jgi:hypothetical protein